jgi:plasmid replication initiation protein
LWSLISRAMNNQLIKSDNAITIKQHNAITEARYEMSALQKNIFYLLLAQLKNENENSSQSKYKLSIQDVNSSRNIRVRRAELRQAARGLITSGLTLYDDNQKRFITIGILASADYGEGDDRENLIVEFDSKLYPFLYNVKSRFTTFTLLNALNLKSKYSKRIYEMLCQFKDTGIFRSA